MLDYQQIALDLLCTTNVGADTVRQNTNFSKNNGTLRALMLNRNPQITKTIREYSARGKYPLVRVWYEQPNCKTVDCGDEDVCTHEGTFADPLYRDYQLTKCSALPTITVDLSNMDYWRVQPAYQDLTAEQILVRKVTQYIETNRKEFLNKLNQQVADMLWAMRGCYPDGTTPPKQISLVNFATGLPNYSSLLDIRRMYEENNAQEPLILGSGGALYNYAYSKANTVAAPPSGIASPDMIGGLNVFWDAAYNNISPSTADNIVALDPRFLTFEAYSEHMNMFASEMQDGSSEEYASKVQNLVARMLQRSTERVQVAILFNTGDGYTLPFDVTMIRKQGCNDVYNIQAKMLWDIWALPPVDCNIECFTGVTNWVACQPPVITCDPVVPPTPVVPVANCVVLPTPCTSGDYMVSRFVVNGAGYYFTTPFQITAATAVDDLAAMFNALMGAGTAFSDAGTLKIYASVGTGSITEYGNGGGTYPFQIITCP